MKPTCPTCWRDMSLPNPIHAQVIKGATIPRSRGYGLCDLCRGAQRWSNDTRSQKELSAVCLTTGGNSAWVLVTVQYIAFKNGEDVSKIEGFDAPDDRSGLLKTVCDNESVALVTRVNVANFWPEDDHKTNFGAAPKTLVDGEDAFGKKCKGCYRMPDTDPEILPRRVQQMFQERKREAIRSMEKDRSDQHIREGQGDDAWALA